MPPHKDDLTKNDVTDNAEVADQFPPIQKDTYEIVRTPNEEIGNYFKRLSPDRKIPPQQYAMTRNTIRLRMI